MGRGSLLLVLALAAVLPGAGGFAAAGDEPAALPIVFYGRELLLLDADSGAVETWDECGTSAGMKLSPDAHWLAYSDREYDIVMCNLSTREVTRFPAWNEDSLMAYASAPAWAPDGAAFAWLVRYQVAMHLYVYDLATGERRVIRDDLPLADFPPSVLWGASGIFVVMDSESAENRFVALYTPDGDLLNDDLVCGGFVTAYFLATDDTGREFLGRSFGGQLALDPLTGQAFIPPPIEIVSRLAPDGLRVAADFDPEGVWITLPDGSQFDLNSHNPYFAEFSPFPPYDVQNIGISPDGSALVVMDMFQGIWRAGELKPLPEELPASDGMFVVWSPLVYRIRGTAQPIDGTRKEDLCGL